MAQGHVEVGVVGLGFGTADGGEAGEVGGGEGGLATCLGEESFAELHRGPSYVGLEIKVLACQAGLVFDDVGRAQISKINDASSKVAFESGVDALCDSGGNIASLVDFLGQNVQGDVAPVMGENAVVGHRVENGAWAATVRWGGVDKLWPNTVMAGQARGNDAADALLESEVVDQDEGQVPETERAQTTDGPEQGPEASEEGAGGFDEG